MANVLTDDDELELEDEEKKKQAAQGDTIGKPLTYKDAAGGIGFEGATKPPSSVPANMPAPEVGAASPSAQTVSGAAPYNPPAPRPESQAFTDWQAQDLAKHPVGQPRYHGLARVADTIAQMTWPGQAAEVGGEMGTLGAEAKSRRLAGNAAEENTQIGYGEKERQANAAEEEARAKAENERVGGQVQDIHTPNGDVQVQTKNIASPTAAIINSGSRENVANTNATSRENVADTNAGARTDVAGINAGAKEATAKIMVGGKAMATKEIQGPDGKAHVMMWNPTTHNYDRDLGEAPPHAAASSAYANTRTVNLIDPESGIPTTFQYNPNTGTYDKPLGTSATGAYGHEVAQAGAVQRSGERLISDIKAHANDLGTLQTWVEKYGLNTPIADPELARLQAELATFSALQPAMHGFRSRSAMEAFDAIIGGLQKNPEATIASIEGILQTAGNIRGVQGTPKRGAANPTAPQNPSGAILKFRDFVKRGA